MEESDLSNWSPQKVEFIAEDVEVSILPTQSIPQLPLVSKSYGPFRQGLPTDVPLWLAVLLKKRNKCRVQYPDWMWKVNLEATVQEEKSSEQCTALPFHYLEVAMQLLTCAPDDMADVIDVRTLIEDIHSIRLAKVRKIVGRIDENYVPSLELSNLCAMELNMLRPFLCGTFDMLYRLGHVQDEPSQLSQFSGYQTPAPSSRASIGSASSQTSGGSWRAQQQQQQARLRDDSARRSLRPLHRT